MVWANKRTGRPDCEFSIRINNSFSNRPALVCGCEIKVLFMTKEFTVLSNKMPFCPGICLQCETQQLKICPEMNLIWQWMVKRPEPEVFSVLKILTHSAHNTEKLKTELLYLVLTAALASENHLSLDFFVLFPSTFSPVWHLTELSTLLSFCRQSKNIFCIFYWPLHLVVCCESKNKKVTKSTFINKCLKTCHPLALEWPNLLAFVLSGRLRTRHGCFIYQFGEKLLIWGNDIISMVSTRVQLYRSAALSGDHGANR